jgi:hypothetical protein
VERVYVCSRLGEPARILEESPLGVNGICTH